MDRSVLWRAAAVQAAGVAILSIALAIALPRSFFDDWGWIAGPVAWAICATVTARVLSLPTGAALLGAALAGLVSLAAVLVGLHWLGAIVAIGLFAIWCARLPAREVGWTSG
jgi:hypothetical protein